MKKREIITLSALTFSMGVVLGFLIAPAKNGFGNNERNTTNNYYINEDPTSNRVFNELRKDTKESSSREI